MSAFAATALAIVASAAPHPSAGCQRSFPVPVVRRTISATYRGTRDLRHGDLPRLWRLVRCVENPKARPALFRFWRHARRAWYARRNPPCTWQLASWYYDAGATASGWHATYGVANKWLPFGTRVRFVYGGRSVWAVVDDRGPYVGGRVWDLSQTTAGALGFGGVGSVCASVQG